MKTQSAYVGFFHNPDYALLFTRLADVTVVKMRNGSLAFQVVSVTNGKVRRYRDLSIARMQAKKHFGSETVFISDYCEYVKNVGWGGAYYNSMPLGKSQTIFT